MKKEITRDEILKCRLYGGNFSIRAVIENISRFRPEIDVAVSESPCCHNTEELRIEDKKIWRGYAYAAGAPHFCGIEEYNIPALKLLSKDTALKFELDDLGFEIEQKR